ncbi:MAG: hypothetical protein IT182_12600 [Acidobacteria bacterium]|nr:hypothetical protein [Acidobacteriota bacterium]
MSHEDQVSIYRQIKDVLEAERARLNDAIAAIDALIEPAPHVPLPHYTSPPRSAHKSGGPKRGLKDTIVTLLKTSNEPISTSDIAKMLKAKGFPQTTYASVYNTLARIERSGKGVVVKHGSAWHISSPLARSHN